MLKTTVAANRKAVLYCRVSTRRQEDEGTSLESQEEACTAYARTHGFEVAHVTREVYSGAELWDRPQLAQNRAALKAGEFGAIIAYSTDRLARNPIHLAIIADECERAGVDLLFVTEPLDSTPEGQLIQYVKGYAAQIEREKIRERTMRGKHARVKAGNAQSWGFPPYGYRLGTREDAPGVQRAVRVVYEPEAAVVRRIFRMCAEEGMGLVAIRNRLNADGVPAPSIGKRDDRQSGNVPHWGWSQVGRILRRPDYKGEAYALLTVAGAKRGQRVPRAENERVRLPADASPAIVSPEVWDAAQARLDDRSAANARRGGSTHLLAGFILCAVCGRPMCHENEHGRRIYRCSSRVTFGGRCSGVSARACDAIPSENFPRGPRGQVIPVPDEDRARLATIPGVERWVWEQVTALLRDPSIIAAELERRREEPTDDTLADDLAAARRSLAKLDQAQARLVRRFTEADDDSFPWELVQQEVRRLQEQKEQTTSTIEMLEQRLAQQAASLDQLDALEAYCERVGRNLDAFGLAEKRLALEALGVRVYANGREWRLECSIPLDTVTRESVPTSGSAGDRGPDRPRPRRAMIPGRRPRSSEPWPATTFLRSAMREL